MRQEADRMAETTVPGTDSTEVADYYRAKAASAASACHGPQSAGASRAASCCGPGGDAGAGFAAAAYSGIGPGDAPSAALLASLGCGNPTAVAELREGETVLDLGCGGGLDLILSARRVGPGGLVFGLDFLEEMLALARRNITDAGIGNIVLLKGHIEAIPLPAATVDVIISNCVINLSADKAAVVAEMSRVLAPGGRIGVSDVVAEDGLPPGERAERGSRAQCVAGAASVSEYRAMLAAAGLAGIEITLTAQAADRMHAAIIRARKPAPAVGEGGTEPGERA
jgi:arsenite methyltransferase